MTNPHLDEYMKKKINWIELIHEAQKIKFDENFTNKIKDEI